MLVDLDAIPRREPGMAPFEVMISESQERMCAIVRPDRYDEVRAVCERWGLPVAIIGRVTDDGAIAIVEGGLDKAGRAGRAPGSWPGSPPPRSPPMRSSTTGLAAPPRAAGRAPAPGPEASRSERGPAGARHGPRAPSCSRSSVRPTSRRGAGSPTSTTPRSRRTRSWVRATARPCCGSRARRRRSSPRPMRTRRSGVIDPWLGAALSVAEATRNVSITGARPLGVTNCLNYGDPTRPEAFWQLREAVRGLGDACRALGLPVTGGNVSLYNESPTGAIAPTPEIGVVGLLDDVATRVGPAFVAEGDTIVLVGEATPGLAGSAYATLAGVASEDGPPSLDLARERAVQAFIREAIARGLVASAQDVSGGGLAVALAEAAMWGGFGARLRLLVGGSPAVELFGESPSRLVVTATPRHAPALVLLARQFGLPVEDARDGRRRPARHRAGRPGRHRRRRGTRLADRRRCRRARRRPPPRLGPRARPSARSGCLTCAVYSEPFCPPRSEASARRRAPSPRSACSPSSTAARSRPAWP